MLNVSHEYSKNVSGEYFAKNIRKTFAKYYVLNISNNIRRLSTVRYVECFS